MDKEKSLLQDIYKNLARWGEDSKTHELTSVIEFVEQAKTILFAAEQIPERQVKQFVNSLKYDLVDFYQQYQADAKHSVYLTLLNETLWSNLAQMTDKSQVEWAELMDDFEHDGKYCTGDHIGFGELECQACQHRVIYSHASVICDCINCGGDQFTRLSLTP